MSRHSPRPPPLELLASRSRTGGAAALDTVRIAVRLVTPPEAVEYPDCNALRYADRRVRAEPDLLDRGLIGGMRGITEQLEDAGGRIERRCKNSEWQRADDRQHVTGKLVLDVDLREGDKAAVEIVYVAVGIGDGDRGTVGGDLCPIVVAPGRRIVGIEIEVRRVDITEPTGAMRCHRSSWPSC